MKIVLLPGLDGTGILFEPLIKLLPSDIEPLIISYPNNKKMNYEELTDYVINKLPDVEYILIGESFSGPIAYQVALRKPNNLKSVIFVASFLSNPRNIILKLCDFLPLKLLFVLRIPRFFIKSFLLGKDINEQIISLLRQSLKKVPTSTLSYRLREIANLHKKHEHLSTRAVCIQPTNDKLVSSKSVKMFMNVMDNLSVYKVDGPHFILQANPLACVKIIVNEIRLYNKNNRVMLSD